MYNKCSNVLNTFLSVFKAKMLASRVGTNKCLSEWQTGKTLIRLLLKKQSDLGLHCLSRPFRQATSVQNLEHP